MLVVLLVGAHARVIEAHVHVLSVVGRAAADGKPLRAGIKLGISGRKIQLEARPGAVVQALLNGKLALALVGEGSLEIVTKPLEVHASGKGAVRIAGREGALLVRGCRFQIDPAGGSLLAEGNRVHVLAGQVQFRLTRSAPKGREEPEFSAPAASGSLKAGQTVHVAVDGRNLTVTEARPAPDLQHRTLLFQPPAPWEPEVSGVDLGQVKRAQGLRHEQQEKEREMATCGCTESGGEKGKAKLSGPEGSATLEKRGATVRVKVRGLPKKVR
jgi:hypothetical protein